MKKILMLGASHFQIPAIKYAKEAGYYVITADYKPDNPGHEFSDEYHNVSTIREEEILNLSSDLNIDGILSYASDPGAPTAAYVSEKMGLPGNPYQSVLTLQRKNLFRKFLKENNFNVPESASFKEEGTAKNYAEYLLDSYQYLIVKPIDSSGSKGVSKLSNLDNFKTKFHKAKDFSILGEVILEQFINKKSYQMDGDGFAWDGSLAFSCFGTQHNDFKCNPHVPVGISFPYIESKNIQERARKQVDRMMGLLDMKVSGLNIEFIIDQNKNIYVLEIGPRSGGNLIPEVIRYATGVDLIRYSVEGALGEDCSDLEQIETDGFYSSYILHARKTGIVSQVVIKDEIKPHIVEQNILVVKGDKVDQFDGSHHTLGTFILKFNDHQKMINKLDNMHKYITVKTS
jgi:biotin carboxylase